MKELTAYVIDGHELRIRPAPVERLWMDRSDERSAYRCLPLNIANAHGWEILCTTSFSAIWDGRPSIDAIRIKTKPWNGGASDQPLRQRGPDFPSSMSVQDRHGVDLFATGPINRPKDGIAPLTGVIETDWSPYTFTMNWMFTRANQRVRFDVDEPFCHIFPLASGQLETSLRRFATFGKSGSRKRLQSLVR